MLFVKIRPQNHSNWLIIKLEELEDWLEENFDDPEDTWEIKMIEEDPGYLDTVPDFEGWF